jgi:hypothetical protein
MIQRMMMDVNEIILTAIFATSLMTVFSYVYSAIRHKHYREPELLNTLLSRLSYSNKFLVEHSPVGWIVHYGVGLLFIIAYDILWDTLGIEPSILNYFFLGAVSGVIGIAGWTITLNLHPRPPIIKRGEFYFQLLPAHIAFGVGAYLAIALLKS